MIRKDEKWAALKYMHEVLDGKIDGKQLSIKSAVASLNRFELLEKYAIGRHSSPTNCCRTAPIATSDASVMMLVGVEVARSLVGLPC